MSEGSYNSEYTYRFHESNRCNHAQKNVMADIAKERLEGIALTETLRWIWKPSRTIAQMRQLAKRWGMTLPQDWNGDNFTP